MKSCKNNAQPKGKGWKMYNGVQKKDLLCTFIILEESDCNGTEGF